MTSPEPGTRQTRRAARRKAEILEAAAKVFAEKGFHRTTVKEIAEAADLAEGTIYNYFESKDDLLISLIDWLADLDKRREMYVQSLDIEVEQSFHDLMLQRFSIIRDRNTLLMAVFPEVLVSPNLRELYKQRVMNPAIRDLEDHLRARVERGHITSADAPLAIRLLTAFGLGLEMMSVLGDTEMLALWDDPERMADLLTYVIFNGILSIPAQLPDSASASAHGE